MLCRCSSLALACLLGAALLAPTAGATPVTYTSFSAFQAALPGPAGVLDFDATAAGTLIPSGSALGGITFTYDYGGTQLQVSTGFDTTSGANFLGTDDGDLLLDGDDFALSFAPIQAIGMFFLTADALFDDDITLTADGATASLVAADLEQTLLDGTDVYFLGVIDTMGSFSAAQVSSIGGGFFFYNVDDIVTVVPEPGTAALLLLGITGLAALRRGPSRGGARREEQPTFPKEITR